VTELAELSLFITKHATLTAQQAQDQMQKI